MNYILWKTKDGNHYFQAVALETEWSWGSASYVVPSWAKTLFNTLNYDKENVEWVVLKGEYSYSIRSSSNSNADNGLYEEEIKNDIKYKEIFDFLYENSSILNRIFSNDVSEREEIEQFGTCDLCSGEGTWTYYDQDSKEKKEVSSEHK